MRALLFVTIFLVACGPVRRPDVSSGPSCLDAEKNGTETDVDCGGECSACANGKACAANTECASGDCFEGTCRQDVACEGESDEAFCERFDRTCGTQTGLDECGDRRTVDCGVCQEPLVCTGATSSGLPGSASLGSLSSAQVTSLCDFLACAWGGYGQTFSCEGDTMQSLKSLEECRKEVEECPLVTVNGLEACQLETAASPCEAFAIFLWSPACEELRNCAK